MKRKHLLLTLSLLLIFVSNINRALAGDGSEANPFSIAEAIKQKDQSKAYWIKGYVVGEIEDYSNNKYFLGLKPPFVGRCNWLLADDKGLKTAGDLKNYMPIQLKTGELCDSLNLDWGPKFWRKEVMVYGKFRDFYATWGFKFVEEIRILTPYPLVDETIGFIDPTDPTDPVDPPTEPVVAIPTYIYEDFNTIEREEPNFDIGKELDRFTAQKGWYGQYVTTAKGKVRLGFEPDKGWVQTPAVNLSANGGNYTVSFDTWDFGNVSEFKRISVFVHQGKKHIQTQELIITSEQGKYAFKGKYGGDNVVFTFSAQKGTKNRFYLDNVDIKVDESALADIYASYTEDFEDGLKELDVDFLTTYEQGEYVGANGVWDFVGAKLDEDASAKKIGRKSAVIRLTDNATGDLGYIAMKQDKQNGAGKVSFHAANYGSEEGAKLFLAYSQNQGATWATVAENIAITSQLTEYTYDVNQGGNIRIKIGKMDQTPMRACIDDVTITSYDALSIDQNTEQKLELKTMNGDHYLYTSEPIQISIYSIAGVLVDQRVTTEGWNKLAISDQGLFILKAGSQSMKLVK